MSTTVPVEENRGYFPHWKEKIGGVIMPEERLPWWQTIVSYRSQIGLNRIRAWQRYLDSGNDAVAHSK
jgi:hypothetical protein